ncbi:hypothetical protein CVN68_22170 (plasmid) [Sphingomonas psychrotolerans]|uniref:Uncharacterized protein n=1 Tax=Sphingomonas psychrotolerans TaxID=1327635 RepID=A0A2K8MPW6_9SPHN|nr:hypothetical protein CVN68_22170 [Sphingomonas psychrotolerans]
MSRLCGDDTGCLTTPCERPRARDDAVAEIVVERLVPQMVLGIDCLVHLFQPMRLFNDALKRPFR